MEKRAALGVHKKKPIKRDKKRLLKKVVDYLKSDCHMFAPLISSPPSDFSTSRITSSSPTGVEIKEPIKEKSKGMVKEVGEYLKSDSYMYASLIFPQPSHVLATKVIRSPPTVAGPLCYLKRVTTSISTRKVVKEIILPTEQVENVILEKQSSECSTPETGIVNKRTQGHREMLKHMVYQNCRSSSMPGHILHHIKWLGCPSLLISLFCFLCLCNLAGNLDH
ncbi:hypothetical protein L1049_023051 [Liquidambar formosana]|uniref:Uncharacterized protein n=1 Tax=Liquidambar formosana TaxID=63359 RepID=A0AAP0WPG4_LIQFO